MALAASAISTLPAAADQSTSADPDSASRYLAGAYRHTCAVVKGGWVRCWGQARVLGLGHSRAIGDDEHPKAAKRLKLGAKAKAIAGGGLVICALQQNNAVRCWGGNKSGELGYGHTKRIGDDEHPKSQKPLKLGGKVRSVTVGGHQSCAILFDGSVRCWGENTVGQLGYARQAKAIGDDEHPKSADPVKLGGKAAAITSGNRHVCAILKSGDVRCWGWNNAGQLGVNGLEAEVGDDEHPKSVPTVPLGGRAVAIESEGHDTCALLAGGTVKCWGAWRPSPETIPLPGNATAIAVDYFTGGGCALLAGGATVSCWGGEGEVASEELPGKTTGLGAGFAHFCAASEQGNLRCWGSGDYGQLGYANTRTVGFDQAPSLPPIRLGDEIAG